MRCDYVGIECALGEPLEMADLAGIAGRPSISSMKLWRIKKRVDYLTWSVFQKCSIDHPSYFNARRR
jgi:hypothetical protein